MGELKMTATKENERIESLDVLRGFALLGILVVNILGFGLTSAAFVDPGIFLTPFEGLDSLVWALVELTSEGAMRTLFSILFGAGVVLFVSGPRAKSGGLHYRRNFWLLVFGLIDMYVLLWLGDILITYALGGAALWLIRNWKPRKLIILASFLLLLGTLQNLAFKISLDVARDAAVVMEQAEIAEVEVDAETQGWAQAWIEFEKINLAEIEGIQDEIEARSHSYRSAFEYNIERASELLLFNIPFIFFLDALMMMVVGMVLYKLGILEGKRETGFYFKMMWAGFCVGLLINAYEVWACVSSGMDVLKTNPYFRPTYHLGRLAMGLGYLGLILWFIKSNWMQSLRARLACVGRMALTNYLMQSLFGLLIFTGAGLGLIGKLSWSQVYLIVPPIWLFQLIISPWWLKHFYFGPVEWLWRYLTYLKLPKMRR
jgi:uncharacterized protein|tara:strand:+ start:29 stop:1318 length:1290 start_codon:yes stop_codon:yes gene_type:complete